MNREEYIEMTDGGRDSSPGVQVLESLGYKFLAPLFVDSSL